MGQLLRSRCCLCYRNTTRKINSRQHHLTNAHTHTPPRAHAVQHNVAQQQQRTKRSTASFVGDLRRLAIQTGNHIQKETNKERKKITNLEACEANVDERPYPRDGIHLSRRIHRLPRLAAGRQVGVGFPTRVPVRCQATHARGNTICHIYATRKKYDT